MKTNSNRSRAMSVLLSAVLLMTIVFTSFPSGVLSVSGADGDFTGGKGTSGDPFIIETAEQLDKVHENLGSHFKLGNDIDLTDYLAEGGDGYKKWDVSGWQPIGDNINRFTGRFDGAGYKITGLWINRSTTNYVGLFGYSEGTIQNLGVEIDNGKGGVNGNWCTGGLVGNSSGSITSSYATGSVSGSADSTGGLVGYSEGSITSSYATGSVDGTSKYTGGLVGYSMGSITSSYAIGSVDGDYGTGGLVGLQHVGSSITSSYATGNVNGGNLYTGGLVGSQISGSITNSYAAGSVSGSANSTGGLVGYRLSGSISDSYFDTDTTGLTSGVANNSAATGVTGLTTADMSGTAASTNMTGFDFGSIWSVRGDTSSCCGNVTYYPELQVFAGSADEFTAAMSQISAIATTGNAVHDNETPFVHGSGTQGDPYKIYTAKQLNHLRSHLSDNKYYKLANDIDLSNFNPNDDLDGTKGLGWQPIGNYANNFTGTFDGADHKITGLWINRSDMNFVGLFGNASGEIKNLGVEIENGKGGVNGRWYTGGLVGGQASGSITSSYAKGSVTGGGSSTGGLVGYQTSGSIENCYATGSVTGNSDTGGLVGSSYGSITSSYATGDVDGTESTGGLVGRKDFGDIKSSYATGSVAGENNTGGLVGYQGSVIITNCYTTGSVTGTGNTGGLVGAQASGSITNCYFDKDTTGQNNGVGNNVATTGVTGLTTADMSGTNASANMGFDFDSTWMVRIDTSSTCCEAKYYPELRVLAESSDEYTAEMSRLSALATQGNDVHENEEPFVQGKGTENAPYIISTAAQLNHLRSHLGDGYYYELARDIDLSGFNPNDDLDGTNGYGWQPIGDNSTPFTGSFDGNDHKITGLWINRSSTDYIGLFGYSTGEIKNLGVEIDNGKGGVNGRWYTGGLVGYSKYGGIEKCYATGSVTGSGNYTGGLVGRSYDSSITNSYATGSVTGGSETGGLVGRSDGSITSSYATGSVAGENNTGGLAGNSSGSITSSYATGSVTGSGDYTGGLVGESSGSIQKCYTTGSVAGPNRTGGLVGSQHTSSITSSYFDKDATGQENGVGRGDGSGVKGLTTKQMVANDTLTTYMSDLGTSDWSKRAKTNDYYYYPELSVFYDANPSTTQQKASEESVRVARILQTVESISAPDAITSGESLSLNAPTVTAGMENITTKGWQIRADGSTNWMEYNDTVLTTSYNRYYLRYYATSEIGTAYSNTVQITVNKCSPSLNLVANPTETPTYPGDVKLTATLTGADVKSGKTISFIINGTTYKEVTNASGVATYTFQPNAGEYTFEAKFKGDDENNASNTAYIDYTINRATQTISFSDTKPERTYSSDFSYTNNTLTDGAGIGAISYTITGGTGEASIDASSGKITDVTKAGTIKVTATKEADINYNEAKATYTLTINKADQTISFSDTNPERTYSSDFSYTNNTLTDGAGDGAISYTISDESTGAASINVATGEITKVTKAGTIKVTATKEADENYNEAKATYTLTISKADQALSITGAPESITYGDSDFTLSTSGVGSGGIKWISKNTSVATVDSFGNVTIVGAGTATITAIKESDDLYNSATAAVELTVDPKPVSITGVSVSNKVYDGTKKATIASSGTIDGKIGNDAVSIKAGTASFDNKNAGTGKTVTFSDFFLTGKNANNYRLESQPASVAADITKKELTVNVTIADKVYDGLNNAAIEDSSLLGVVGKDKVILTNGTAVFNDSSIGDNKPITFTSDFTISGDYAGNYSLTQPTGVTGNITEGFTPIIDTHYTLSEPDGTDGWYKAEAFTITAESGYKISVGNLDYSDWVDSLTFPDKTKVGNVSFYVRNTTTKEISVVNSESYKLDKTAPSGEIEIKSNSFKSFLNKITFGLFFKETVDVNITGTDETSGIASIEYIKTDAEMDSEELEKAEWTSYDSLSVQSNEAFIIYARITDNAGNVTIINSDGVVVYTDSEQDTESISYTRTSGEDVKATVKLNGNTVSSIKNGEDELVLDKDYIVDNDTGVITFKSAYLETLSAGDYTLTVSYNPMGYDYKDTEGNAAPATTTIALSVAKAVRSIEGLSDITKTYGDKSFKLEATAIEDPTFAFESSNTNVATVDGGKVKINGAGATTITVRASTTDDYEAAEENFTLTVEKATLTVTTDDVSRKYGEANPEFTVNISGYVNEQGESVLTAHPTATCAANANSEVGEYDIILSDAEADDYEFSYINGTLTVIADTAQLEDTIEQAENIDRGDYSENCWHALQDALESAKDTLNKDGVMQAEVYEATQTLLDAIDALVHEYEFIAEFDAFTGLGSASGTVNAPYDKFVRLLIDGAEVDSSSYTITEGSTVITLSEEYLKTLKNGSYTIIAEFTDGSAYATLNIDVDQESSTSSDKSSASSKESSTSSDDKSSSTSGTAPSTGDPMIFSFILLMVASIILIIVFKKKAK